jgi:hypothetical protein
MDGACSTRKMKRKIIKYLDGRPNIRMNLTEMDV